MIKRIFILLLFCANIVSNSAMCKEVTLERAERVAVHFIDIVQDNNVTLSFIEKQIMPEKGITAFYVFGFTHGFIIISGVDNYPPVIAFSNESTYATGSIAPAFQFWMKGIKEKIEWAFETQYHGGKEIEQQWNSLTENAPSKDFFTYERTPLLVTSWNQGLYYNSALPVDSSFGSFHPWTGCVATALAQILNYYHFPEHGTGTHGIYSSYGWLEADFENTYYDWVQMENKLTSQNQAVAELNYQCVVAVNSQIFPNGTGAYDNDAKSALINYFGFNDSVQFLLRDSYAGDWPSLIKNELDANRPVIYGGIDGTSSTGHTFICDGYAGDFLHINWGWGGQYNGYYYLDTLTPANYHFDMYHDAIVGISPVLDEPLILHGPENLTSEVAGRQVTLHWDSSANASTLKLLGYNVFRNDTILNYKIITGLLFTDTLAPAGDQIYKVVSVFIGKPDGPDISVETSVSGQTEYQTYFNIYPNPAKEHLLIHSSALDFLPESIEIFNLAGQQVLQQKTGFQLSNKLIIKLPLNLNGLYLLNLNFSGHQSVSKKILIKN